MNTNDRPTTSEAAAERQADDRRDHPPTHSGQRPDPIANSDNPPTVPDVAEDTMVPAETANPAPDQAADPSDTGRG